MQPFSESDSDSLSGVHAILSASHQENVRPPPLKVSCARYVAFSESDAVGTTIAGRPPHRSVRARWRIRLLPWMPGRKAGLGIRMQDSGEWNPAFQQQIKPLPGSVSALAATI
jgi:hypothetical protein